MADSTLKIEIVSAEAEVFSGVAEAVIVPGRQGELGIYPGHTALLSHLKPGEIRIIRAENEELFYVSGGLLEVQPHCVTILADTVIRAADIDEVAALEVKKRTEKIMADRKSTIDFNAAAAELAEVMAQLRALQRYKNRA